jgi:hypothetical protein
MRSLITLLIFSSWFLDTGFAAGFIAERLRR